MRLTPRAIFEDPERAALLLTERCPGVTVTTASVAIKVVGPSSC